MTGSIFYLSIFRTQITSLSNFIFLKIWEFLPWIKISFIKNCKFRRRLFLIVIKQYTVVNSILWKNYIFGSCAMFYLCDIFKIFEPQWFIFHLNNDTGFLQRRPEIFTISNISQESTKKKSILVYFYWLCFHYQGSWEL